MANLTLDIPNNAVSRIASAFGYQEQVPGPDGTTIANPQTRAEFMQAQLKQYIKNTLVNYETQQAFTTATKNVSTSVNAINIT